MLHRSSGRADPHRKRIEGRLIRRALERESLALFRKAFPFWDAVKREKAKTNGKLTIPYHYKFFFPCIVINIFRLNDKFLP